MLYGLPLKAGQQQEEMDVAYMSVALDEALEGRGYRQVKSRIGTPLGKRCFRIEPARDGLAVETNPPLRPNQLTEIYSELERFVFDKETFHKYAPLRKITE